MFNDEEIFGELGLGVVVFILKYFFVVGLFLFFGMFFIDFGDCFRVKDDFGIFNEDFLSIMDFVLLVKF